MDPRSLAMLMQMGGGGGGGGNPLSSLIGNLFSRPDQPYKDAMKEFEKYGQMAAGAQNPFMQFGQRAMPGYEQWLGGMKDPSGFINKLMGGYQESPFAKFQQEQGMRAAQNMGSAGGLTGSTPLTQFAQQQAQGISSQDMNQWLQNVLGINQQYGQGLFGQIGTGQHAADMLSQIYGNLGQQMAGGAYGAGAAQQGRTGGIIGSIGHLFGL